MALSLDELIQIVLDLWIHDWCKILEILLNIRVLAQLCRGFVHQDAQLVLDGLELIYFHLLLVIFLARISWSTERTWIRIRNLLLLHLHALVSEHLLPLLHEIHLHIHCLLEILISEIKNLSKSLLIHANHLLLIFQELVLHDG